MSIQNQKHEVPDPGYYDSLISKQKKLLKTSHDDVEQWLELGRLYEAKIDLTNRIVKKSVFIRLCLPICALCFLIFLAFIAYIFPSILLLEQSKKAFYLAGSVIPILFLAYVWYLRYPPSGKKYFKKVLSIDPECWEACMHLGLIALRKRKKQQGCRFLEQAIRLGAENHKIERELKSIYEKEFVAFFQKQKEMESRQQDLIRKQAGEIQRLRAKSSSLEQLSRRLTRKVEQTKWQANREKNLLKRDMNVQMEHLKEDYEEKMASIRIVAPDEEREQAEGHFARLTTEIMESKAELDGSSFSEVKRCLEEVIGEPYWRKLSEESRRYLATAEHTFNLLMEEDSDYGLVGMELCKALETELNRKLVDPFVTFMEGKESEFLRIHQTGTTGNGPSYFTYLARVLDRDNYPNFNGLTIGQYLFVLKLALEGDYALSEYRLFLDETYGNSSEVDKKGFLKKLETVTHKYRNAIAHQSPMTREQYENLRDLVFSSEDALLVNLARL